MVGKSQKTTQQNSATSKTPAPTSRANASSVAVSKDDKLEAKLEEESSTEVHSDIHSMQKDFTKKSEDVLAGINGLKSELQSQAL